MRFYIKPVLVQKAKKLRRTPARALALQKKMSNAIRVDFVNGIQTFKKRISPAKLYDAWANRDYAGVTTAIPWDELPGDLSGATAKIHATVGGSAGLAVEGLPIPVQASLRYDVNNPRIRSFLNRSTASMVTRVDTDAKLVIRDAVTRHFTEALTPDRMAGLIKNSIGLLPEHARAVRNYSKALQAKDYPLSNIEKYSTAYADRLLDYRAMMIARTESQDAMSEGQLSVWREAENQDLIQNVKKKWIVDGDPCEICVELGEQEAIGLEEEWYSDIADDSFDAPTAHPHCECILEVEFD